MTSLEEQERGETLVPDEDYIKHIISTVQKTVKCEDILIRQILYTGVSKDTDDPQNLGILCPTSEGKTYAVKETLGYFPQNELWSIGAMSPKVLVRDHSILIDANTHESIEPYLKALKKQLRLERIKNRKERDENKIITLEDKIHELYENSKRLIILEGMLLVCLEPPHSETWKILKPILSHDKYEIEYPYVDKIEGVGTKTIKIVTRGWPACIFCSAKNESNWPEWPEIQSRFLISSTNMIQQKYIEGNQLTGQKYGLPRSVQQAVIVSDKDVGIAKKCVIRLLSILKQNKESNQQHVWIPYYKYLVDGLPADKGSDNRLVNRIFALLSIITQCNAHKRFKLQVDNEILPIADIENDLAEVLYITHNQTGIPSFKMKVFAAYNDKNGKPDVHDKDPDKFESIVAVTTKQCCDKYKQIMGKSINSDTFKKTYLDEFVINGLLDYDVSAINRSRHIYYPIVDVSLYNWKIEYDEQKEEESSTQTRSKSRFMLCLRQSRPLSSKIYKKIFQSWLELEIIFILEHRIGEDDKAQKIPELLNNEFSLRNERGARVCIHDCKDFLSTPSLIHAYSNTCFVEDSQETKERVGYLQRIYPCSCKHNMNQTAARAFDVLTEGPQVHNTQTDMSTTTPNKVDAITRAVEEDAPTETRENQSRIFRLWSGEDTWGCMDCDIKGDRFCLEDHLCKTNRK